MEKHIVALGGGGFSMEPENPLLDQYILGLSKKAKPKVCFIGTASGDSDVYVEKFYSAFSKFDCEPAHLSLFKSHPRPLENFVLSQDIFYVGGGNTRNMLVLWKEWGLDKMLFEAHEKGAILCGISAGSICWFEWCITDSIPGQFSGLKGLGWLGGTNCPHFDGESGRQAVYRKLVAEGEVAEGIAADDSVAHHFVNGQLHRVVSSVRGKNAYEIKRAGGGAAQSIVTPEFLGDISR